MTTHAAGPAPPARARDGGSARSPGGLVLAALAAGAVAMLVRSSRRGRLQRTMEGGGEAAPAPAAGDRGAGRGPVVRRLSWGASALSLSVLADSSAEHYRGGFHNPAMYVAPVVSALTLATTGSMALTPGSARPHARILGATALVGVVGTGFHVYNVSRRVGGWSWENLFYGAPIAAPLGLTAAGLLGLAATHLGSPRDHRPALLLGLPAGRVLAAGAAMGILGTAAEAGLLHFRGAFQHPAMYLPVTVPPLAALALGVAALRPTPARRGLARWLLRATAAAGIGGVGFHARGVARSMGGWRNWRQNLLAGPPLPAPPAFTGMALAGLGGLALLEAEAR